MEKKVNTRIKQKILFIGMGISFGAIIGWAYWYYYGCQDTCTIRSSATNMTIYGALMGGLLVDMIREFFARKK
jgi:hypothetical protein